MLWIDEKQILGKSKVCLFTVAFCDFKFSDLLLIWSNWLDPLNNKNARIKIREATITRNFERNLINETILEWIILYSFLYFIFPVK